MKAFTFKRYGKSPEPYTNKISLTLTPVWRGRMRRLILRILAVKNDTLSSECHSTLEKRVFHFSGLFAQRGFPEFPIKPYQKPHARG
jgi:hypothetical protein